MKFQFLFHRTSLHVAIKKGQAEIVKLLLQMHNIDANAKLISCLLFNFILNKILIKLDRKSVV